MVKTPVLCVVGPTASGKTAMATRLAHLLGGEIISMDSMQVYRRMNIGTAKPTLQEREGITHHLLDVADPTESFTVAQYVALADAAIRDCAARGVLPILTGGTGFYLRALTDGLHLGGIKSDPELRESFKQLATEPGGPVALHNKLQTVDPETAARLHPNDVQRVSRALEVFTLTGIPLSKQKQNQPEAPYCFRMIGITMERETLYERINRRVDDMLSRGLLTEVRTLLDEDVPADSQAMQGIGYKELVPVLLSGAPLSDAIILLKQNTRHYAKRQWTWFRAEPRITWLDISHEDGMEKAFRIGEAFWKEEHA